MERQTNPDCVHLSILPGHLGNEDQVIQAFIESAEEVKVMIPML